MQRIFKKIVDLLDYSSSGAEDAISKKHAKNADSDLNDTFKATLAKSGANSDITSMTGLSDDGIPLAKVATAAASGANADITSFTALTTAQFSASVSANQADVTGDGTAYSITGAIWTEGADRGSCFSNGTFTAQATKQHLFTGIIVFDNAVAAAHTYGYIALKTSNRDYYPLNGAIYNISLSGTCAINFAIIADMDINDTAYLQVAVYYGTKTIDVTTLTRFAGYELQ